MVTLGEAIFSSSSEKPSRKRERTSTTSVRTRIQVCKSFGERTQTGRGRLSNHASWPGCGQFSVNGVGPRSTISICVDRAPSGCREWDRFEIAGRSHRVHARFGLRGSHIGEASNPGPSFLRLRRGRFGTVNIGIDIGQLQTTQMDRDTVFSRASSRRFAGF